MPQTAIQGQQTTQAAIGLAVLVVATVWWVLASDASGHGAGSRRGAPAPVPPDSVPDPARARPRLWPRGR